MIMNGVKDTMRTEKVSDKFVVGCRNSVVYFYDH